MESLWKHLPDLALVKVFSYLPLKDRVSASMVCVHWSRAFEMASLWCSLSTIFLGNICNSQLSYYAKELTFHDTWIPSLFNRRAIQFAEYHGNHLKYLKIICDPIYRSKSSQVSQEADKFLKRLTESECQLKQLIFESYFHWNVWESHPRQNLLSTLSFFMEKQKHLETVLFYFTIKEDDVKVLKALVEGSGSSLSYLVYEFYFFRNPISSIQNTYYELLCGMPNLQYVKLNVECLDDTAIKNITENCSKLKIINILSRSTCYPIPGVSAESWKKVVKVLPKLQVEFEGVLPLKYSELPKVMAAFMPLSYLYIKIRRNNVFEDNWDIERCIDYIRTTFYKHLETFWFGNMTNNPVDDAIMRLVMSCSKLESLFVDSKLSLTTIQQICRMKENSLTIPEEQVTVRVKSLSVIPYTFNNNNTKIVDRILMKLGIWVLRKNEVIDLMTFRVRCDSYTAEEETELKQIMDCNGKANRLYFSFEKD